MNPDDGYAAVRRAARAAVENRSEYERVHRQHVNKRRVEEACTKAGFPVQQGMDTGVALGIVADALESLLPAGPRLGLATTRELLLELESRGRVTLSDPSAAYWKPGKVELRLSASQLLRQLPDELLNYRTKGSQ